MCDLEETKDSPAGFPLRTNPTCPTVFSGGSPASRAGRVDRAPLLLNQFAAEKNSGAAMTSPRNPPPQFPPASCLHSARHSRAEIIFDNLNVCHMLW
ncbi:Hypothetical protein SMAX5B_014502 [Scophthalmus maximus]|uniref:Uncharacterized protein n=1 Tax=Scophthalmus maximus TaxID=52904 RepID=A0A2U9C343_SCOMX|nr:Hypothetical protein SMAX5B_014502 [Scophthalmus maximus]